MGLSLVQSQKIKVINGLTLIVDTISGTGFSETETITGRDGNQTGVIQDIQRKRHCCKQQTIRLLRYRPNTRDILKILSKRFYTISRFKRNTKRKINIKEHRFFIQTKRYSRVSQVLDEITLW